MPFATQGPNQGRSTLRSTDLPRNPSISPDPENSLENNTFYSRDVKTTKSDEIQENFQEKMEEM